MDSTELGLQQISRFSPIEASGDFYPRLEHLHLKHLHLKLHKKLFLNRTSALSVACSAWDLEYCKPRSQEYVEVVRLLLSHGAKANGREFRGIPLVTICRNPHISQPARLQIVQLLLDHGADVHAKGSDGKTCLYHVDDAEIRNLLLSRVQANNTAP
jgi:hypothetical protein